MKRRSLARWSHWIGRCVRLPVVVAIAGCANTGEIRSNQVTIDPDKSVFVFSFNAGALSESELPIKPGWLHLRYGTTVLTVPVRHSQSETKRFVLEVPANNVRFSQLELTVGDGIVLDHYMANIDRNRELTPGTVTYLGRIAVEEVEFHAGEDGAPETPAAVRLLFHDAFEDDMAVLRPEYRLFQTYVPDRENVRDWAGQDYLALSAKVWDTSRGNVRMGYRGQPPPRPRRSSN